MTISLSGVSYAERRVRKDHPSGTSSLAITPGAVMAGFLGRIALGFERRQLQAHARMDLVVFQTVRFPDRFDRYPGVLRGRVVVNSNRPQGVAGDYGAGDGQFFGVGPGTGVEGASDDGRQEHCPYPSPAVYVRWFHPGKIKENLTFPNGLFR